MRVNQALHTCITTPTQSTLFREFCLQVSLQAGPRKRVNRSLAPLGDKRKVSRKKHKNTLYIASTRIEPVTRNLLMTESIIYQVTIYQMPNDSYAPAHLAAIAQSINQLIVY